jgi:hypothetical protein
MAIPTDFEKKIRGILVLHKPENEVHNVLCVLGLARIDFNSPSTVSVAWDEDGIAVMAKKFPADCSCAGDDAKLYKVDGVAHSSQCAIVKMDTITRHALLTEMDTLDTERIICTFQWPRDLSVYKNTICARFPELGTHAPMWDSFVKNWGTIMKMIPEPSAADLEGVEEVEEIVEVVPDAPVSESFDDIAFDEIDFTDTGHEVVEEAIADPISPEPKAAPEDEDTAVLVVSADDFPAPAPMMKTPEPAAEPKRGRGRPSGTTKASKKANEAERTELSSGDFDPDTEAKRIPACIKFARIIREECARFVEIANTIESAESFPIETLEGLKDSLDRLSLRSAHMVYQGGHEEVDNPHAINGMVEVTLANVTAVCATAVRDLGLAPEKATSWEKYGKAIKEALDVSKSMTDIMSQAGIGPTITE